MRLGPVEMKRPEPVSAPANGHRRDLKEILANHEVVDVDRDSGVILVAPSSREIRLAELDVDVELGASGTRFRRDILGGEEYNRELAGHQGIQKYDQMRRSDSTVRHSNCENT